MTPDQVLEQFVKEYKDVVDVLIQSFEKTAAELNDLYVKVMKAADELRQESQARKDES